MNSKEIRNNLVVELHVPDFDIAKKFYSILGFEIILEHPITSTETGYLVMKRKDDLGDTIINFYGGNDNVYNQSYFKNFPKDTKRGYAVSLTMPVFDIEKFYNEISPKIQNHIKQKIKDKKDKEMTWKDFRIEDPFGFYLRFTELINWGQ